MTNDEIYKNLGWQIWSWRIGRGMTQEQLAEACGVSRFSSLVDFSGEPDLEDVFPLLAFAVGVFFAANAASF